MQLERHRFLRVNCLLEMAKTKPAESASMLATRSFVTNGDIKLKRSEMNSASSKRRQFVPQFSLRALLIVVTLSAVGTVIWFRWPIVEDVDLYAQLSPAQKARTTPRKMLVTRRTTAFRQVWGGGRVREGWRREYNFQGQIVREELWRDNLRHGPYRLWRSGKLLLEGKFVNGRKDGVWRYDVTGDAAKAAMSPAVMTWRRGMMNGVCEFHDINGAVVRTMEYCDNSLIEMDGQPFNGPR